MVLGGNGQRRSTSLVDLHTRSPIPLLVPTDAGTRVPLYMGDRLLSCDLRLMLPLLHAFRVSAFWIPLIGGIPESGTDVVYRD